MDGAESDFKLEAHRLIDQLPPDASWADLAYAIHVRRQLEAGIRDADAGKVVTTEELRKNLGLDL